MDDDWEVIDRLKDELALLKDLKDVFDKHKGVCDPDFSADELGGEIGITLTTQEHDQHGRIGWVCSLPRIIKVRKELIEDLEND